MKSIDDWLSISNLNIKADKATNNNREIFFFYKTFYILCFVPFVARAFKVWFIRQIAHRCLNIDWLSVSVVIWSSLQHQNRYKYVWRLTERLKSILTFLFVVVSRVGVLPLRLLTLPL